MGYVEDETREKQRADLRERGGTLREFAELEARRRNWGPAQRRLGLAMSAWQFFVIRRRHGRFLAKERARLRALGLGPPEAPPCIMAASALCARTTSWGLPAHGLRGCMACVACAVCWHCCPCASRSQFVAAAASGRYEGPASARA